MSWKAVFNNPMVPTGPLLTQATARRGLKISGGYVISDVSPSRKRVTIYMPSSHDLGSKFAGRTYTYSWDGTGFKRQGQYLHEEGPVENPTSVASAMRKIRALHDEGVSWEAAARTFMIRYPNHALDVMDRVGTWPSSEPEIRALQKVWR